MTWLIYSPLASWTSIGITIRLLGTLVGFVALSAVFQHRFRGDENWLGLGLSLGLGLLSIFSIGIGWLVCALLFGMGIRLDRSDEPLITSRGLTLQAIGIALVLIATLLT